MFLVTDVRLPQGVDVEVVLMLPKEIGIPESTMARCRGRILRTENNYGQLGVAAEINTIESYFAPNGIIRLASA